VLLLLLVVVVVVLLLLLLGVSAVPCLYPSSRHTTCSSAPDTRHEAQMHVKTTGSVQHSKTEIGHYRP
jgi:hypothetical protein